MRAETDLAIFYGKAPPEGWTAHPLFDEIIAPVVAPDYRTDVESGAITEITLLDYRKEAPEWVNWETLTLPDGGAWFPKTRRRDCSSYIQSISLALEGKGVGLGVLPMLAREIGAGRLVTLGAPMTTGHRYFLATPEGNAGAAATRELVTFLQEAARDWDGSFAIGPSAIGVTAG